MVSMITPKVRQGEASQSSTPRSSRREADYKFVGFAGRAGMV